MELAGVQYMGLAGLSTECEEAVMRLIQFGDQIKKVQILTSNNSHALLLTIGEGEDLIVIKSGFTSGYGGGGPHSFSYILQLLERYCDEIYEYKVDNALMVRLDKSALTKQDIAKIEKNKYIGHWHDYIFDTHFKMSKNGTLWEKFPFVIPLSIIDNRIADLAISFWENPDDNIFTGYRRLEDIIRTRTKLNQHSAKLFQEAFIDDPKLQWKDIDKKEQIGRGNLFVSVFGAHRNPRAHKEIDDCCQDQLSEFLLLNHLYRLEKEAYETNAEKKP